MPDARCTRGLVCTCIGKKHTSNNEYTGIARHSRTQWFYGLCRALPGDRALLPPSPADRFCLSPVGPTQLRELDASVGASGPHDFAVRNIVSRPRAVDRSQVFQPALQSHRAQNAAASTAPLPASVTIMIRPSGGVGWREFVEMICPTGEAKYFCKGDWTPNSLICPSGRSIREPVVIRGTRAEANTPSGQQLRQNPSRQYPNRPSLRNRIFARGRIQ